MAPVAAALTKVLITGFGPFYGVTNNPSWAIASRLPATLDNNIQLIVYPAEVPVAYHPVASIIPALIAEHQPDVALHIGVAEGRSYFAVEQSSTRRSYEFVQDIYGEVFTLEEQAKAWGDAEAVLQTDLDLNVIVDGWQNGTLHMKWPFNIGGRSTSAGQPVEVVLKEDIMETEDVRWSDNVGNYLCGFMYYMDLVEMGRSGAYKKRDVAFMHVPLLKTEEEFQFGVEVTVALIQAMVDDWRAKGRV
ncbi:peptidase C15, pyroglutamyl peptidase I-like protein [Amniculicola lignicola CBS 123094]|uniref:Peptidase C15, pyroglutamyl peptidase I-like protein n=1 Tax=Amniculicola lignicola CBS 123094 TaxID=1392246 RepID=A0A6A5WXH1_9PLEO|nr:peptidase C15, pyroglutamyl peptidase I-like protein [Amniculicola lignicola CBS 123094]